MIEMTAEQAQAVEKGGAPTVVVHPGTREEFVLIRKERYESMQKWAASLKRNWDNPADDDLIKAHSSCPPRN